MLKLCTPGVTHFRHTDRDRRRLNLGHLNQKPRLSSVAMRLILCFLLPYFIGTYRCEELA